MALTRLARRDTLRDAVFMHQAFCDRRAQSGAGHPATRFGCRFIATGNRLIDAANKTAHFRLLVTIARRATFNLPHHFLDELKLAMFQPYQSVNYARKRHMWRVIGRQGHPST